jgi:hypothetical protein
MQNAECRDFVPPGCERDGGRAGCWRVMGEGGCAFILFLCTRFEPGDTKVLLQIDHITPCTDYFDVW